MSGAYPRPVGEIEEKVVDKLWPDLDEAKVGAWADCFHSAGQHQAECSGTLATNGKQLVAVFKGEAGTAASEALGRRASDYDQNSQASEQDRAHAQSLAEKLASTKAAMSKLAHTVRARVDEIRFRAKLENKPANVTAADEAREIAQGRKACQELADQLRDAAKTIASNSGASDSDGDDLTMGRRAEDVATTQQRAQATQRVEEQIKPAEHRNTDEVFEHRDGSPAERERPAEHEQKDDSNRQQSAPAAQTDAQSGGPSSSTGVGHDSARSASSGSDHGQSHGAGTRAQSALSAEHVPHQAAPLASVRQEPVQAPGSFAAFGAQPAPSAQRAASTGAPSNSAPAQPAARPESAQPRREGNEQREGASAHREQFDPTASTSAMSAGALAPPSLGSVEHTPWSASDPNRVAPSGHYLGAGGTGGAGVRDGYLITGEDPDQQVVDETCAHAAAVSGAAGAARSLWRLLPPSAWVVAGFKNIEGDVAYRAFPQEGMGWAHPGATLPQGVDLGLTTAPLAVLAHAHPAATALDWLRWAQVGQPESGWALIAFASTLPVPEDLAWEVRLLNEQMHFDELRREAVVREIAPGSPSPTGVSRLAATNEYVADYLAGLPPQAVVAVGAELAVGCVEDTAAERRDDLRACVTRFRNHEALGGDLLQSVGAGAAAAQQAMARRKTVAEQLPVEERAFEMLDGLDEQAVLSAGVAMLIAANLPNAPTEALARQMLADVAYEHLMIGGDHESVHARVQRAFQDARRRVGR